MIARPAHIGAFQFVVLAALRTGQLRRGCVSRVDRGHTIAVTAQMEVAEGFIVAAPIAGVPLSQPVEIGELITA